MNYYTIGEREIVLAFKMTGVDGTVAQTRQEVLEAFNRITGRGSEIKLPVENVPKILILTERAASLIEAEEIEWQKTGKYPLIVEVPGLSGGVSGKKSLTDAIREAVGIQI